MFCAKKVSERKGKGIDVPKVNRLHQESGRFRKSGLEKSPHSEYAFPPKAHIFSLLLVNRRPVNAAAAAAETLLGLALALSCASRRILHYSAEIEVEPMGDESDAFYVVRKGNVIGVYRSMSDVQAIIRSSENDPGFSVFKGYGLPKEAEDHLASRGLKNAIYSINAQDVQENLFGQLVTCPFRLPATSTKEKTPVKNFPEKRPQEAAGSASFLDNSQSKLPKTESFLRVPPISSYCNSCTLEFDGASKGNPGLAGAGAVLRAADNSVIYRLREGVGTATNNAAEYRGVILGLKYALEKGFKHIRVQGDSKLVCMQVQGLWKCKNQNMADLCKVAKELKDQFLSFEISHVDREYNSDADRQANLGVYLKSGEIQVECNMK